MFVNRVSTLKEQKPSTDLKIDALTSVLINWMNRGVGNQRGM